MAKFLKKKEKPKPLEGSWGYKDIVGSKVSISSLPVVSNYRKRFVDNSQDLTVEDVIFKVSRDGEILPLYKFLGIDEYYPSQYLTVLSVDPVPGKTAICGCFLCGEALCGHNCESDMATDIDKGGIVIVNDDNSVVIKERAVNIVGATVEDPEIDQDGVTKIQVNFEGDILD